MTRDTRLTLWPEQMGCSPLANSWADIKNTCILDLSQCEGFESCGLAASALNLHYLFNLRFPERLEEKETTGGQLSLFQGSIIKNMKKQLDADNKEPFVTRVVEHDDPKMMKLCSQLGFFEAIKTRLSKELADEYCQNRLEPVVHASFLRRVNSMPLCHLDFSQYTERRRDILQKLFDHVDPVFDSVFVRNQDKGNQLTHVLEEIVKNIADHANADGLLGLDVIETETKTKINLLVGDLGPGIYQHISEKFFAPYPSKKNKGNFADGYKLALTDEVSGSDSEENYGCGMSSIVNNCLAIGTNISVFDQYSRLVLSSLSPIDQDPPSYNDVWRSSFRVVGKTPFYYFLECEEQL